MFHVDNSNNYNYFTLLCINHHHWAAVVSRGWANASACCLQASLSCAVLCHIVSLQYLSRSSLHRLAGLPCRLFLSYGLQVMTYEVHRSSLRRLICPAQDHLIFLTLLTFVLCLTQMLYVLITKNCIGAAMCLNSRQRSKRAPL